MTELKQVKCEHWSEGECKMGFYGGRPSYGTCTTHCPVYLKANGKTIKYHTHTTDHKPRKTWDQILESEKKRRAMTHTGLGDTVKWLIETVSFGRIKQKKGCGCAKRQSWLNRHFPYRLPKWLKKGQ